MINSTERKKKAKKKDPLRIGWGWRGIYVFAAVSLIIYIIAIISTPFANFFTRYPASAVRAALSYITYLLPISLAEIMLILLIPTIVVVVILACRKYCDSWRGVFAFSAKLGAALAIMFILFVWTLGTGYRTTTLDKRLDLGDKETTAESVADTSKILIALVNEAAKEIEFGENGFSVMPYSLDEMNTKLMAAYKKISQKYDFIPDLYSRTKPVMISELMSYTHITGVYSYFTGEANINVAFPDFTIPYTAAHELAHQRGVAREDEANFIAFLVCLESDDPYIKYSGYVMTLEYLLDAHYLGDISEGHSAYRELYFTLSESVRNEQKAYYEFFQKYDDNIIADVSGAVNDAYLQSQGTPGRISYGLVVDLAVKYYSKQG